jgi:hypothetical protein
MRTSLHRLVPIIGFTLIICALAALTVAASSFAQTRGKTACSASATHHSHGHHSTRTCTARRRKPHHTTKHHGKRPHTRKSAKHRRTPHSRHTHTVQAARCEDGSTPSADEEGAYSCADGSEPECENGAAPTFSSKTQQLTCGSLLESADEPSCEELEELEGFCSAEQDAQACEAAQSSCEQQQS